MQNENNTYTQFSVNRPIVSYIKRKFQNIFGISLPLISNLVPHKTHITVVVGQPIECPRVEDPSAELVQHYLDIYIEALTELYNANCAKYNAPPTKPPLTVL